MEIGLDFKHLISILKKEYDVPELLLLR